MGAFISSKYALHYPEHVKKVAFFSPWASEATTEEHVEDIDKRFQEMSWARKLFYRMIRGWYSRKGTPFGMARTAGRLVGGYGIKRAIRRRFAKSIPEDEMDLMCDYMHHIIMNKGCSEPALNIMFPNFMVTEKAISNFLEEYIENNIEISFYYGTHDWMNSSFNGDNVSRQIEDNGHKVYIIEDAGHHIYFDNPAHAME